MKPLVPQFRPDLCARLIDIAEKQVPANLKPVNVRAVGSKKSGRVFTLVVEYLEMKV